MIRLRDRLCCLIRLCDRLRYLIRLRDRLRCLIRLHDRLRCLMRLYDRLRCLIRLSPVTAVRFLLAGRSSASGSMCLSILCPPRTAGLEQHFGPGFLRRVPSRFSGKPRNFVIIVPQCDFDAVWAVLVPESAASGHHVSSTSGIVCRKAVASVGRPQDGNFIVCVR